MGWGGCLFEAWRLFEVGANSRFGASLNRYGTFLLDSDLSSG